MNAVGIFDSGVGGLAVQRAVRALLPAQPLIYVADSGYAPYGERDDAFIAERAALIADALIARGAFALVVAFNTATVTTLDVLRTRCAVPIVGIEPAIKPAAQLTRSGSVLVLATPRTANSAAVARLCAQFGAERDIILQPCPGLADRVEAGAIDDQATLDLLRHYLAPATQGAVDTVVLGCTHFAFLHAAIRSLLGPAIAIVEPSDAVARQLLRRLPGSPVQASRDASCQDAYYTTAADPARVGAVMSKLLGHAVEVSCASALGLAPGARS